MDAAASKAPAGCQVGCDGYVTCPGALTLGFEIGGLIIPVRPVVDEWRAGLNPFSLMYSTVLGVTACFLEMAEGNKTLYPFSKLEKRTLSGSSNSFCMSVGSGSVPIEAAHENDVTVCSLEVSR